MGSTSVTGKGNGASKKATVKDLAILENGPQIMFCGQVESTADDVEGAPSSPPSSVWGTVKFPYVLEEGVSKYSVILTTLNGGLAYVIDMIEDDDDNFIGFTFLVEAQCTVMYLVVRNGSRPQI